jgi:hypothetical protein
MWQARPIRVWPAARQDAGRGWHDLAVALKISDYGTLPTPSSAQGSDLDFFLVENRDLTPTPHNAGEMWKSCGRLVDSLWNHRLIKFFSHQDQRRSAATPDVSAPSSVLSLEAFNAAARMLFALNAFHSIFGIHNRRRR